MAFLSRSFSAIRNYFSPPRVSPIDVEDGRAALNFDQESVVLIPETPEDQCPARGISQSTSHQSLAPGQRTRRPDTPAPPRFLQQKAKEPAKFDGKTDLLDWLSHFDTVAKWNGYDNKEKHGFILLKTYFMLL